MDRYISDCLWVYKVDTYIYWWPLWIALVDGQIHLWLFMIVQGGHIHLVIYWWPLRVAQVDGQIHLWLFMSVQGGHIHLLMTTLDCTGRRTDTSIIPSDCTGRKSKYMSLLNNFLKKWTKQNDAWIEGVLRLRLYTQRLWERASGEEFTRRIRYRFCEEHKH